MDISQYIANSQSNTIFSQTDRQIEQQYGQVFLFYKQCDKYNLISKNKSITLRWINRANAKSEKQGDFSDGTPASGTDFIKKMFN